MLSKGVKTKYAIVDMGAILKKEFQYFLAHHEELVKKYKGKYVVIKDDCILGAYSRELEAIRETSKTHDVGTFLVQKCEPGMESYTQTFHSRVAFA